MQRILVIHTDLAAFGIQHAQGEVELGITVMDIGDADAVHFDREPFASLGRHAIHIRITLGTAIHAAARSARTVDVADFA